MMDWKMLLVILGIALLAFGTKLLRSIGADLGSAIKGFKQAMGSAEVSAVTSTESAHPRLETGERP